MSLTAQKIKSNWKKFENTLLLCDRKGMADLLKFLNDNNFNLTPASVSYHQNYTGGLVEHSLSVFSNLNKECKIHKCTKEIPCSSRAIVSLLHDVCKYDNYIYNEHSGKWSYNKSINGKLHAEKSISIIKKFIELTEEEELAIKYHMGIYRDDYTWNDFGNGIKKYPLVYLLHVADMKDTYNII